jgi:hypothetical protein
MLSKLHKAACYGASFLQPSRAFGDAALLSFAADASIKIWTMDTSLCSPQIKYSVQVEEMGELLSVCYHSTSHSLLCGGALKSHGRVASFLGTPILVLDPTSL